MPDIFTPPHEKKDDIASTPQVEVKSSNEVKPVEQNHPTSQSTEKAAETPPEKVEQEKAKETMTEEHNLAVQKEAKSDPNHPIKDLLKSTPNPVPLLAHYCEKPTGIKFVNQEDDETIVLFVRRHLATNLPWFLIFVLLLFLPIIIFVLFSASNFALFSIPISLIIILTVFYYLIICNYALLNFINWFYDIGVVTKKRLLDLDADNILHHHMAETEIEDVVDVSYAQRGFFQSFFNYGTVHIQTEAIKANFEYIAAPKPSTVSDIISDLKALKVKGELKDA